MSSRSTISYEQLKNLSDVLITALVDNDVLVYDATLDKFVNTPYGVATDLSILGETNGDILYFNGTNWVRLAKGTAGQILQTGTPPSWVTPSSSSGAFLMSASTSQTFLASTVYYQWLYGQLGFVTTETGYKASMPFAFTWSNIRIFVLANNATANGSVKSRKNEADGNQNVVITASTTGEFTDAVNTDSIVAGDEIDYKITIGSGGNTQIISISSKGVPV